jgi:hypothetical protein
MTAIDRESVTLATMANDLRRAANAAKGYHPLQHGGTYGAAHNAVKLSLACGIAETNKVHFDTARDIVEEVYDTLIDCEESIEYILNHHGIEIIEPSDEGPRPRYRFANGLDGFDG